MLTAIVFVVLAFVIVCLIFFLNVGHADFRRLQNEFDTLARAAWKKAEELSKLRQKYEALQKMVSPFKVTPEMAKAFELPELPPGVDTAAQVPICGICKGGMQLVAIMESLGGVNPDTKVWECPACNPQLPLDEEIEDCPGCGYPVTSCRCETRF